MPEPLLILLRERAQTRFAEFVVAAKSTVPAKPFRGATVIVELPATPTLSFTLVGFAATVKSCSWYLTVVLCERLPLEPVTVAR